MAQNPYFAPVNIAGPDTVLNISAATLVKTGVGVICRVNVTTAGSTVGGVYDFNATTGEGAANLVSAIPNAVGNYEVYFKCDLGILIVPGTGQVVSVAYA
ncbi:MAG: hypothetical protein M0Z78_03100 [Betaproteobacteria bacterium]|nr:hypothetical protein [Betaproteobacteria bacterium]